MNKFRKDINGLRALAVISVVLFHFSPVYVPGGFAGVDVFFVISGYLMTSIILRGIESNNFSFMTFIKNRVKRIVPALIVTIFFTIIIGFFLFEPLTYQLVGQHGLSSLLFISNIIYNSESGYFDTTSFSKLFLHTWSLSVEWQFYILYPILIYSASRYTSTSKIKLALLFFFFIFLLVGVITTQTNKSAAYFLIYSRGWEMIAGGLAFIYPLKTNGKIKKILELTGITLIITSFFIFSSNTAWPGLNALLPVAGAYLCILSANTNSIFSNKLIQYIGLWSYSIYLIHWPLIVTINKLSLHVNFILYISTVILLSFIMYSTIEKKTHNWFRLLMIYVSMLFILLYISNDGMGFRVDEFSRTTKDKIVEKYYGGSRTFESANGKLYLLDGNENYYNIILSGDSYSQQYNDFWFSKRKNSISVSMVICLILPDYTSSDNDECNSMYNKLLSVFDNNKTADIVINQNWMAYETRLTNKSTKAIVLQTDYNNIISNQLEKLIMQGGDKRHYYIIGTYDYPDYDVIGCLASSSLPINKLLSSCKDTVKRHSKSIDSTLYLLSSKYEYVHFISPKDVLCKDDKCKVIIDDKPVQFDGDHLSIFGADVVGNYIFRKIFNKQ